MKRKIETITSKEKQVDKFNNFKLPAKQLKNKD
jgi:hypothetical protein